MPFIPKTLLIVALAALPFQAFSQTATGETTVNITIPGRLIFSYYSIVNVDIPADVFDAIVLGGDIDGALGDLGSVELTAINVDGTFSVDANIPLVDSGATLTNVTLVLQNVWSLSSTRDGTISPSITTAALTHEDDGASSISLSNILVSSTANTTASNPFAFIRTGLGSAVSGHVHLAMNLENALSSGSYNGGVYELLVELD